MTNIKPLTNENAERYNDGRLARRQNKPRYYGCHCGMRSTLETSREAFYRGWDDEDFFQMRRASR